MGQHEEDRPEFEGMDTEEIEVHMAAERVWKNLQRAVQEKRPIHPDVKRAVAVAVQHLAAAQAIEGPPRHHAALAAAQDMLSRAERILNAPPVPPEPGIGDGSVLLAQVQHNEGGPRYDYAFIRANGKWYSTEQGRTKPRSWQPLYEWLRKQSTFRLALVTGTKNLDIH